MKIVFIILFIGLIGLSVVSAILGFIKEKKVNERKKKYFELHSDSENEIVKSYLNFIYSKDCESIENENCK